MSVENLFGTPAEQDDIAVSVRKAPQSFAQDHMSPLSPLTATVILSLLACSPVTVASVMWCTG